MDQFGTKMMTKEEEMRGRQRSRSFAHGNPSASSTLVVVYSLPLLCRVWSAIISLSDVIAKILTDSLGF